METFNQAVGITVIGMGLTFAAIGLLLLAMMALTRWTRGRAGLAPFRGEPSKAIPADERVEELERAAAIAVAVALGQAARPGGPSYAWHTARPGAEPSPWQGYARGQQLEQRKTHQTLRW